DSPAQPLLHDPLVETSVPQFYLMHAANSIRLRWNEGQDQLCGPKCETVAFAHELTPLQLQASGAPPLDLGEGLVSCWLLEIFIEGHGFLMPQRWTVSSGGVRR